MSVYLNKVRDELKKFKHFDIFQVPKVESNTADSLAQLVSSKVLELLKTVPVEALEYPTIQEDEEKVILVETMIGWMLPIHKFLSKGKLPEDKVETRSASYIIYDHTLYRRGYSTPLFRCLNEEESGKVLREIHEWIYGNHTGGQSLAYNVLR